MCIRDRLGDEAVGAGGARVDLVLHQVVELEHVDVPDGHVTVEGIARAAVTEADLSLIHISEPTRPY